VKKYLDRDEFKKFVYIIEDIKELPQIIKE